MILDVIEGRKIDHSPVWFMRQAGRYMAQYRAIKEKHTFLDMCKTPDLAAEVTLQPVKKFGFDAAIIFSDILLPLERMGFGLEFNPGPVIKGSVETKADVDKLKIPGEKDFDFLAQAIRLVTASLPAEKEVIGFCGAPFTLFAYIMKEKHGIGFEGALKMKDSAVYAPLMEKVTEAVINCALAQVKAGVKVFQIFDTWAGLLEPGFYGEHSAPYVDKIAGRIKAAGARVIYFFKNGWGLAEAVGKLENIDVLSVDSSMTLAEFNRRTGNKFILQGNLDPAVLLKNKDGIKNGIDAVLADSRGLKGHIFNLGHGVIKETPEENVMFAVEYIKSAGKR